MKDFNIRFETIGCRLNQIESESAASVFIKEGFTVCPTPILSKNENDEKTILCIVNTCAVTQKSEQKDRRIIRLLLEKCPNALVIVTGCYAQLSANEIKSISPRVAVLKGQLKSRITKVPELLKSELNSVFNKDDCSIPGDFAENFAKKLNQNLFYSEPEKPGISEDAFKLSADSFVFHSRSSIKIQDGCNCKCSYCTINIARGKSVSLDAEEVISRVQKLEHLGQAEVVITAVNISQYYGKYKDGFIKFSTLLRLCLENTKNICFRISSLYPESVDDDFCEVIKNERIRPYFHLSVQSGSNKILKLMKRSYTFQTVENVCKKLRSAKENPFISCDIITGFPSETDEDFNDTFELCKKCNFSWVHVFPFSARPGTEAFDMKPKIPQETSGKRAEKLTEWAKKNRIEYINSFIEKTVYGVLETVKKPVVFISNDKKSVYHALSENFLHCKIVSSKKLNDNIKPGSSVKIKILSANPSNNHQHSDVDAIAELVDDNAN